MQRITSEILELRKKYLTSILFFKKKDFIYLLETEKQRHRQREKQVPCREPDVGLDPRSPGSGPGLTEVLNH